MNQVSKIASTAGKPLLRRLPLPFEGLDLNFCRDPLCATFGIPPDPFKRRRRDPPAPKGAIRGVVAGKKHEFYRRFGKTAKGDPGWQCRLCAKTFSIGKPARRHKRSDKNRLIFQMLCNDTSLSKISKIADISHRDLYGKIDYFHDRVRAFTAERQDFSRVDFRGAGSRFATDSQTLIINWPTKRERTSVAVQHLCTAHACSGFIMQAALQFDPLMSMDDAEARAMAASEDQLSVAFRTHARVWTKTEFEAYLASLQKQKRVRETDLYQLPHQGVLVRYDILQYAHALRVREMVSSANCPIFLAMDDDRGLQQAFAAAFAAEIRAVGCDIAVVSFDKGMTNDKRNQVVADGQVRLVGMSVASLSLIRTLSDEDDAAGRFNAAAACTGIPLAQGVPYRFPRKSETSKVVKVLTSQAGRDMGSVARLPCLATLRSVDSCFHRFRSNVRFPSGPSISSGSVGHTWDRHYLYKPELITKIAEIYRFHHNWCEPGADKKTPAMRLGLAPGRVYERDFL